MPTLLLKMSGPLQSWGTQSRDWNGCCRFGALA